MNILPALIASLLLAPIADAPTTPKFNPGAMTKYKPDLSCSVRVSRDAAGTQLVENGGSAVAGGGTPSLYVHVTITNKGHTDASIATHSVSVKRNASTIAATNENIAIPAGLSKIYSPIKVTMSGLSNALSVNVRADANGQVSERSELNNVCSFSFEYSTVH